MLTLILHVRLQIQSMVLNQLLLIKLYSINYYSKFLLNLLLYHHLIILPNFQINVLNKPLHSFFNHQVLYSQILILIFLILIFFHQLINLKHFLNKKLIKYFHFIQVKLKNKIQNQLNEDKFIILYLLENNQQKLNSNLINKIYFLVSFI